MFTSNHTESECALMQKLVWYFKVWPGHCICDSVWWQLAFFLCQIPRVFTAGLSRHFLELTRHKYINCQLRWISKCRATSCPTLVEKQQKQQASRCCDKETVINQLCEPNKDSVFQSGQKVTGAWWACIRVIFWKGGSNGCQDPPVVMDPRGLGLNQGFWYSLTAPPSHSAMALILFEWTRCSKQTVVCKLFWSRRGQCQISRTPETSGD